MSVFADYIRPIVYPGPLRGLVRFTGRHGKLPRLRNPLTFSEKVFWRMCFDRRPILKTFCDKHAVRDYVADRVGREILTTHYIATREPRSIDWNTLPNSFVLKASNGCGWNVVVNNRKAVSTIRLTKIGGDWLKRNYFNYKGEWSYKGVTPRILVEELLVEEGLATPLDYKFLCFDGKVKIIMVDIDRFKDHRKNFYDRYWNFLPEVRFGYECSNSPLLPPANLNQMLIVAEKLAAGMDMLRVDLYNLQERIVFGELTNYPLAGARPFSPPSFDLVLGSMWNLPDRRSLH